MLQHLRCAGPTCSPLAARSGFALPRYALAGSPASLLPMLQHLRCAGPTCSPLAARSGFALPRYALAGMPR